MEKNELSACLSHKAISILHRLVQSSFVLIVLGCGGSHDQSSSQTANQIAQVSEKTFCETSATCAGLNGFAIDGQGSFTAGPSSTGKTVSGSITSAELASLKSMVNSVMANSRGIECSRMRGVFALCEFAKLTPLSKTACPFYRMFVFSVGKPEQ